MSLSQSERDVGVSFAVAMGAHADKAKEAKALAQTLEEHSAQMPAVAKPLIEQLSTQLHEVADGALQSTDAGPANVATGQDQQEDEEVEEDATPFSIGEHKLPLRVMIKISTSFEPEDLTVVASACKSFCIAININLQYMYMLLRFLRFVVVGANVDDASDSTSFDGSDVEASVGERDLQAGK
eukprot:2207583-Amphidinium_carterae.1